MLVLVAGCAVRIEEIRLAVVADDFQHGLVGAGDVFVFDVEDGIDRVFPHQGAKPVLDAEAGEEGGILGGGLPIEVELRGPPGADTVFELKRRGADSALPPSGFPRAVLVSISRSPGSSRSWE